MILHHAFHVQVFDADHVVLFHQASSHLVKVVPSLVAQFFMGGGEFESGFLPVLAAFLFPREPFLKPLNFDFFSLGKLVVLELFPVGGDHQILDAEVQTNHGSGFFKLIHLFVATDRAEVFSVRISLYGQIANFLDVGEIPMRLEFDHTDLWNENAASTEQLFRNRWHVRARIGTSVGLLLVSRMSFLYAFLKVPEPGLMFLFYV